jgi:hypothetical protein
MADTAARAPVMVVISGIWWMVAAARHLPSTEWLPV